MRKHTLKTQNSRTKNTTHKKVHLTLSHTCCFTSSTTCQQPTLFGSSRQPLRFGAAPGRCRAIQLTPRHTTLTPTLLPSLMP